MTMSDLNNLDHGAPISTPPDVDDVGSDFSWSSASLEASTPNVAPATSSSVPEDNFKENVVSVSTRAQMETTEEVPKRKHSTYFWDCITFEVEDITFQLPKYRFVEDSEEFMLLVANGKQSDRPIELDATLGDFENFLKAFIPRSSAMYDERPILSQDEWISVLKLSTKWFFHKLRRLAIFHLSSITMDGIDRICLGKEYWVYDWVLEGYQQVIERLLSVDPNLDVTPTILSAEEGRKIGMDVALELSGIAIRRMRGNMLRVGMKDVKEDILETFRNEFCKLQDEGCRFMNTANCKEEDPRATDEGKTPGAEGKRQRRAEELASRKRKDEQRQLFKKEKKARQKARKEGGKSEDSDLVEKFPWLLEEGKETLEGSGTSKKLLQHGTKGKFEAVQNTGGYHGDIQKIMEEEIMGQKPNFCEGDDDRTTQGGLPLELLAVGLASITGMSVGG